MQENPLLPFAFMRSESSEIPLDTTPRERSVRDENASSMYHTRKSQVPAPQLTVQSQNSQGIEPQLHFQRPSKRPKGPVLKVAPPSLKRKPGASFSEKDNIKRREVDDADFNDHSGADFLAGEEHVATDATETTDTDNDSYHGDNDDDDNDATRVDSGFSAPPSSPPLNHYPYLASEFDFSTKNFEMPDSPNLHAHGHDDDDIETAVGLNASVAVPSSSVVKVTRHLSSDADFGIDRFNRFKPPAFPSTDDDRIHSAYNSFSNPKRRSSQSQDRRNQLKARDIVLQAFEDVQTKINLEGLQLKDIPEEIRDFDDLVVFNDESSSSNYISYQLYLTNNKIRILPPALFKFTKLNVLALRQNKLSTIPPLIGKLKNLTDLYIGANRIRWLPSAFLDLSNLSVLSTGPNPFIQPPEDAIAITTATLNNHKNRRYASKSATKVATSPPSLRAICLNSIAKYDVSYQETKNWKRHTPKLYHSVIAKAIRSGHYENTCSECDMIVVEPAAEAFEWWDILGNKLVPIKREFCCGRCYNRWELKSLADK